METQHLVAGTPEWHAHRATHFNASDAPAMLGCSPYMTRTELLHKLHTGLHAEHDAATERRFADGHRFEALARPLAEQIIGDDLAPVVGTLGELSASFDGLTLMGDTAFEHKTLNDDLRATFRGEYDPDTVGDLLAKNYRAQMEQQLLVSGADRVLFMASKWDGETLVEERHCWYYPNPALRAEIVAGWKQLAADLAAYKPAEVAAPVTAGPIEALPALSVQMQGSLAVHSNLDLFGAKLREFVARIPARPDSEQEFADCDAACKALKRAEEALDGAEASALGQVQSVEQVTRMIADLRTVARTARLASEKMVKARKEQIRTEEVQRGKSALAEVIAGLNTTIGKPYMPAITADFAGVISGKKTVDSVRNAIDTELARAKIAANEIAGTIVVNLRTLRELAEGYQMLFPDTAALVLKAPDDCRAVVTSRIAQHQAEQAQREADTRERIRAEEQAKAELVQVNLNNLKAYRPIDTESSAWHQERIQALKAEPMTKAIYGGRLDEAKRMQAQLLDDLNESCKVASEYEAEEAQARQAAQAATPAPTPAPVQIAAPALSSQALNVVPLGTRAPSAPSEQPTLSLGDMNSRLGFTMNSAFVRQLGIVGTPGPRAGVSTYRESEFDLLCEALVAHIRTMQAKMVRAA